MKGVILAAGDGGRLRPLTRKYPKVLLPMYGKPLISYSIEALVAAGVTEIAVVVGYRASHVVEELPQYVPDGVTVEFVTNPHYLGGNALSVYAAQEFVGTEEFVLCMGDHVIDRDLVRRLLESGPGAPALCVDSAPTMDSQTNDATRVVTDHDGSIIHIGKELPVWDAVDTGVFLLGGKVFDAIGELQREYGTGVEMSQAVNLLANNGTRFATVDIHGLFWTDVDTVEDYEAVARLYADPD